MGQIAKFIEGTNPAVDYAGLARLLQHEAPIRLSASTGESAEIPAEMSAVLKQVVLAFQAGRTPQIVDPQDLLSTEEAAQILGITRPTLVRLLDKGEIEFSQPAGSHRRISASHLAAYQEKIVRRRRGILDQMTQDAAESDEYEQSSGFVSTR